MPRLARGSGTLAVVTAQTRVPVAVPPRRPRSAVQAGDRRRSAGGPCLPASLESCDINILPFTTQVKHLPHSPPHDHPLKLKVTFCVQGVISPLLANIYLNALDVLWERQSRHLGVLVRYADDAVVLCRTRSEAEEALRRLGAIMDRLSLKLHPDKTRIVELGLGKEGFVFLGCYLHTVLSRFKKREYLFRWPSPKAMTSITVH